MPVLTLVAALALLGATFFSPQLWVDLCLALAAAACLVIPLLARKRTYFLPLVVLAAVPVVPTLQYMEAEAVHEDWHFQKMGVEDDLLALAGRIERQLITNTGHLNALELLLGHVEGFDQAEYEKWLDRLTADFGNNFLNIAVVNDFVITHVYPPSDDNSALVGTDLREVEDQADNIRWVMENQEQRIGGPLKVMQGDTALVYRLPVHHEPNMVVTGVLSLDEVLETATLAGTQTYHIRLTVERDGEVTELVSADQPLDHHAITTGFSMDGIDWTITGKPAAGYVMPVATLWMIRGGGVVAWLFLLLLLGHQHRVVRLREVERQQLMAQEKELLEAQRLGRLGSWHTSDDRHYVISAPLAELIGSQRTQLDFDRVMSFIYEPDREYFRSHTQQVLHRHLPFTKFEHRVLTSDTLLWVEHSVTISADGRLTGMLRDITDIKASEAELQKLAYYDSLTGASNRNFFGKQVQQAIALTRRNGNHLALVIFDLDDFKVVNATYGHTVGDEVLKQLTERVKNCIRRSDTVARLSGDTFAICLQNLKDAAHCVFVADTLLKAITEVVEIDDKRVSLTATLGLATCPEDDISYEGLVKKAEMALQKAKEVERGYYQFYSDQLNQENERRQDILRLLPAALNNDEFHLVLQPRVTGLDQTWSSIEVLIRWESETLGFVSPGEFIPIAEGSHLIVDIGNWVIRHALAEFSRYLDVLPPGVALSINLSPRQLEQKDLARFISGEMKLTGVPANRIEFEITEHSLTIESDTTLDALTTLSSMGIRFAMDDFGTGYSNLAMLQELPLSVLKIDQRFVQQLNSGPKHRELVRAIINMGHTLGLTVVAEGVETPVQEAILKDLGCDELQGFYYYRPQRMEALIEGLERAGSETT